MPRGLKNYFKYVIPVMIIVILVQGLWAAVSSYLGTRL